MKSKQIDLQTTLSNLSPERRALLALKLKNRAIAADREQAASIPGDEETKRIKSALRPPLIKAPSGAQLPLSFAQQRLWFLDQMNPGNIAYNMPEVFKLTGALDVSAVERAYNEVTRRHEVLRTSFKSVDGLPVQKISPELKLRVGVTDLSELEDDEREQESRRITDDEARTSFDLSQAPLLRLKLIRLDKEDHIVLQTLHHIVSDGWSLGLLRKEVTVLYRAFSRGEPSPLPEMKCQYSDFAFWQREWLKGEILDQQLDYWIRQLDGLPPALNLPTDRPRPPQQSFRGDYQTIVLGEQLSDGLKSLSRREATSLFMTLLAAFKVFLYRYSAQSDFGVGVVVANRSLAEIEPLIGLFVNTLVLRTDLSGNPTFREFLQRVRNVCVGAYSHQDLPFERIVEALQPERDQSRTPLFQIVFDLYTMEKSDVGIEGLTLLPMPSAGRATKFDLTFFMVDAGPNLIATLDYSTDLFDKTTITTMLNRFEALLTRIVADQDARLDSLEILTAQELRLKDMESAKRKQSNLDKLMKVKPKAVRLTDQGLVKAGFLESGGPLPLLLQPQIEDIDLAQWTRSNKAFLESCLLKHGAILFRGFHLGSASGFEEFARSICADLFNENGEHPREIVGGSIYTPVFYPPDEHLLWHTENSFNSRWPMKIWFYCMRPADSGGETPIVDNRRVLQLINPSIRERFEKHKIIYMRNYGDGLGLDWQTVFQCRKMEEAEEACRQAGIEFEWKQGGRLRTRARREAIARHPKTGEWVWFNQATHWHPHCLSPAVRESLFSLFSGDDLPRNCCYGDGTAIESEVMEAICEAYRTAEVCFQWQAEDILMLDNMLTAHARNPFEGPRKIYVTMGEMMSSADL